MISSAPVAAADTRLGLLDKIAAFIATAKIAAADGISLSLIHI